MSDQIWITLITSIMTLAIAVVTAVFAYLGKKQGKAIQRTGEATHHAVNGLTEAREALLVEKDREITMLREALQGRRASDKR